MSKELRYLVVMVMLLAAMQATASQWQSLPSQPASGRGLEASFGFENAQGQEVAYACVESVSGTSMSAIFKSSDLGQTWSRLTIDQVPDRETSLCAVRTVLDLRYPGIVYAAEHTGGVLRSTDGGVSWTRGSGLEDAHISVVAVCQGDPDVAYAGEGRLDPPGHLGFLYRTSDQGLSWTKVGPKNQNGVLDARDITDIAVLPDFPDTVILSCRGTNSTLEPTIYWSGNGGQDWSGALYPQPVLGGSSIMSLAVSGHSAYMLAGDTVRNSQPPLEAITFASTNCGRSWGPNTGFVPQGGYATSLVFDPSGSPIYASTPGLGVWKSPNGGLNWVSMNDGITLPDMNFTRLAVDDRVPAHLLAGEKTAGFYAWVQSTYVSWSQVAHWTPCDSAERVVVGNSRQVVSMSTRGVVSSSANGGASWTSTDTAYREAALVSPHDQVVIHTLQNQQQTFIRTSTNFGHDWLTTYPLPPPQPQPNTIIAGLAFVPSTPSVLYCVGHTPTPCDLVLKSTDDGADWTTPSTFTAYNHLSCLALHQTSTGDSLFIGSNDGKFVPGYDDGQYIYLGSPVTILQGSAVRTIAVKPNDASILYAGLAQGVYKSVDGGLNWVPANAGILNLDIQDLVVDPQNPGRLWVATKGLDGAGHVYASLDDALSWTEIPAGLPLGALVNGLFFEPGNAQQDPYLYAATSVGVFRLDVKLPGSDDPNATAPNSSRKLVREPNTQNFHLVYASSGHVWYSHSEDGGQTWSDAEDVDEGSAPAIILNPPGGSTLLVPWVVYEQNDNAIRRAIRYPSGTWDCATVYFNGEDRVGAPALAGATIDPLAYVVYPVTRPGAPVKHSIFFNMFTPTWVYPWQSLVGFEVARDTSPSIAVTPAPGDIIHVCWNRGQSIVYSVKQYGTPWQGPFSVSRASSEPASHPSVEAYGDRVYCVWRGPNMAGSFPGDIWQNWRYVSGPPGWPRLPQNLSLSPGRESDNPEMSTDFVTVWNEQEQPGSSNFDIWAKFDAEPASRPIFTSPLTSMLPHVTGYWQPDMDVFHTKTIWTEDVSPYVPPYEVRFEDYHWPPPLDLMLTDPGTYYGANVGESVPSFYCTARDSYVTYQNYSVDYGQGRLSYRLPYLNPRNNYLLRAVFYHEGRDTVSFELRADSASPLNRNSLPFVPETMWVSVPKVAYQRTAGINCGIRKTRGDGVSVAGLKLFQVEAGDHRGSGGGQSAEQLGLPRLLLCQNAPNPFRTATSIRYQLPSPGNVSIRVLDVTGRLIRELAKEKQRAGEHEVRWNGRDTRGRTVVPGVYFYHLQTEDGSDTRRAVLVR